MSRLVFGWPWFSATAPRISRCRQYLPRFPTPCLARSTSFAAQGATFSAQAGTDNDALLCSRIASSGGYRHRSWKQGAEVCHEIELTPFADLGTSSPQCFRFDVG